MNDLPPCLIFIGVTGVGKSTASKFLEQEYVCQRVQRTTTRLPRRDDDARFVTCVQSITFEANDFRYEGWSSDVYRLCANDVRDIRAGAVWPLIELGAPCDAIRCKEHFRPARLIWLKRKGGAGAMRDTLRLRNPNQLFDERIESLDGDLVDLETRQSEYDFIVENDGDIGSLERDLRFVAEKVGCFERR